MAEYFTKLITINLTQLTESSRVWIRLKIIDKHMVQDELNQDITFSMILIQLLVSRLHYYSLEQFLQNKKIVVAYFIN